MIDSAISVKNLSVSYGSIGVVSDININIKIGEFLGITGSNGGGKTTVLSAVLGILKPDSGEISVLGTDIFKGRNSIGYVPQTVSVDRQFPISVIETVMTAFLKSGLHPFKRYSKTEKEKALCVLKSVGLNNKADNLISELSGGEFQRVLIARALVNNPEILLLDEPTSNIDKESRNSIYTLLKELNNKGVTVVMVTHDLQSINNILTRLICINRTVVYDGNPSDFLKEGNGDV